jgi:hypothetical protein
MVFSGATDGYDALWTWLTPSLRALRTNCACDGKDALGPMDRDGYKIVCTALLPSPPGRGCLVYSLGSNGNFGFENALHARLPACHIVTFDMDTYRAPPHVQFVRAKFGRLQEPLSSVRARLGHARLALTLLKVDVEGAEWDMLPDIFSAGADQIQLEIHEPTMQRLRALERIVNATGYCLADVNPNIVSLSCVELLLVKVKKLL